MACLVPTFEAGRLAALGKAVPDRRSAAPAWSAGPGTVLLPVYDSWFFTTANSGDLETLARRLRGCDLSATSRPKKLDVSTVSGNTAGKVAPFLGALKPVGLKEDWTGPAVAAAAARIRRELEHAPVNGFPVVGLPVYGSIPSGQPKPVPGWLEDLNLDPRRRVAAGLGAAMVREHQEDLVDEAWRQAGDIQRARREREGALLADFVSSRLHARMIAPLGGAHTLVAMAPALARTRDTLRPTLAARVESSVVPGRVLDAPFRRILATKAPPAVRNAGQGIRRSVALHNTLSLLPGNFPGVAFKVATVAKFTTAMNTGTLGTRAGIVAELPNAEISQAIAASHALSQVSQLSSERDQIDEEVRLAALHRPSVKQVTIPAALSWPAPAAISRAKAGFAARVAFGSGAALNEATGVIATPSFPQPLADWLDPAFLLSGIDVPPDSAGALETNTEFIEALLVGANHELARELLWRGLPLDREATLLNRFFQSQVSPAPGDVTPMSDWTAAERLGSHVNQQERSIMILRSPLVSHLSETAIFLAKAETDGVYRKPGNVQVQPLFRGFAGLDTAYFGFDLPPEDLVQEPGWYLVIQELAGATRFGLDEEAPATLNTWSDLAWPNVAVSDGYLAVAQKRPAPLQPNGLVWGKDSAHMASITLQRPIRLSIHTSLLTPQKG